MQIIMTVFWFVIGAVFGSAANALIYRLPRGISWTRGHSICPSCKHGLGKWDLIPLLSFLSLGGKCRYCNKNIGSRYFWIELITALSFVLIIITPFNPPLNPSASSGQALSGGILLCMIFWVLMIIAVMDWETKLISDAMVILLGILVTGLIFFQNFPLPPSLVKEGANLFFNHLWGAIGGVGVIGGLWAITKGRAMGSGDIGLQAILGWGLGWEKTLVQLWMAFVTGAIVGGGMMLMNKLKLKSEIAFGPFLIIGAVISYVWGERILQLFLVK